MCDSVSSFVSELKRLLYRCCNVSTVPQMCRDGSVFIRPRVMTIQKVSQLDVTPSNGPLPTPPNIDLSTSSPTALSTRSKGNRKADN